MTMIFDTNRSVPAIMGHPWEQLALALRLVHELTHVFTKSPNQGEYGHLTMALAAKQASETLNLNVQQNLLLRLPERSSYEKGDDYDTALSNYFDRVLEYGCRKVKL